MDRYFCKRLASPYFLHYILPMRMSAESGVILSFNSVYFSYGPIRVLEDVNFHLHSNEFTALVGANGSGKTTVLKLLLGLEKPLSGTIELFGSAVKEGLNRIGYVPQQAGFDQSFPVSVAEVVRMGRLSSLSRRFTREDQEATEAAMELTDTLSLAARSYSALSGGQRRRVMVARALAANPDILILDEPTANMDSESEERLFATLGSIKGTKAILIVTHDTAFVSSLTDSVLCVKANAVFRHGTEPVDYAPPELFGGKAAKVLHGTDLPDRCDCNFGGKRT